MPVRSIRVTLIPTMRRLYQMTLSTQGPGRRLSLIRIDNHTLDLLVLKHPPMMLFLWRLLHTIIRVLSSFIVGRMMDSMV